MTSIWSSFSFFDSLKSCFSWVKKNIWLTVFVVFLGAAAFIRFWAAPLSAGPDVGQFWSFTEAFKNHGLDFYQYADASADIFIFKNWGFVYPPIWLLILGLVSLFVPSSLATGTFVDTSWRIAMKTPIILADLAIGVLIYHAVPGPKWRKLVFAGLWLLHPTAWFESGVFGQFDAIAALFLLACVIMLIQGKDRLAFLFAGLAVMTKQHTFIPVAFIMIICARDMPWRRFLKNCAITGSVIVASSLPFLITGNFFNYFRSFLFPGTSPGYQDPLVLSFSGTGSLLTYLHNIFGWDTLNLISITTPILVITLIIAAVLSYRRMINPLQGALVGILLFISLYYRINYQYLVIYIPLAILLASRTQYKAEKVFGLVLAIFPAVWVWLTNIPWWFNNYKPYFPGINPILASIGMQERYLTDNFYVCYTFMLMCIALIYILIVFEKWHVSCIKSDTALKSGTS